jgi:hypothetical protein
MPRDEYDLEEHNGKDCPGFQNRISLKQYFSARMYQLYCRAAPIAIRKREPMKESF